MIIYWNFLHLFYVSRYLSCLQLLRPVRMLFLQESCWYKDECDNDVPFSLTSAAEEGILVKHDHIKRARGNRPSISPLRLRDNGASSAKQQSTDIVS